MHRSRFALSLLGLAAAAACSDTPIAAPPGGPSADVAVAGRSYVILGKGNALPASLAADVAAAGGTLTSTMPRIGVAVATSSDPAFAARIRLAAGVQEAGADTMVQWISPTEQVFEAGDADGGVVADVVGGSDETFYNAQWAPKAIHAPEAWAAGATGSGARVAILDGGIHSTHIDIAPNLDVAHSASFVPGQAFNTDVGTFWHGTHVAGIVAAADNGIGTIGIAPSATLIGVKVLHNGSGAFEWVIAGIYYAATPIADGGGGADIINMSLGALFPKDGADAAHLINAIKRAVQYANAQGVTVIASAGNDAVDFDHTANLVSVPALVPGVLTISALGPMGMALTFPNEPPAPNGYDRLASYSNYGQSAIDFGAPGGDFAYPGNELCTLPRIPSGTITTNCWVFDMVMAPCRGGITSTSSYCWAAGTSMAAPATAGVAALLVQRYGRIPPAHVEQKLRATSDDLGKPGNDDAYGGGRVNAYRAWTQ